MADSKRLWWILYGLVLPLAVLSGIWGGYVLRPPSPRALKAQLQEARAGAQRAEYQLGEAAHKLKAQVQEARARAQRAERQLKETTAELLSAVPAEGEPEVRSQEFVIDDYCFTWTVVETADVKMQIEKTQDALSVWLLGTGLFRDSLRMTPKEAEAVGAGLGGANGYYEKMRRTDRELDETLDVGKYSITFRNSPKYGFSISVRPNAQFGFQAFRLERKDAVALAPELLKAQQMAHFVDKKVRP